MALSFHLVKRPDMRKDAAEGSKLFYAQVRSLKKLDFNKLCDLIAVRSTPAFRKTTPAAQYSISRAAGVLRP